MCGGCSDKTRNRFLTACVLLVVAGVIVGIVVGVLKGGSSNPAASATLAPTAAPTVSHTPTAAPTSAPSTQAPSPTLAPTTRSPTAAPTLSPAGASISSAAPSQPVGAIAGGVVGAAVALVLLALVVTVRRRRAARRRGDGHADQRDGEESVSLEPGRDDGHATKSLVTGRAHTEADDLENAAAQVDHVKSRKSLDDRSAGGGGDQNDDEDDGFGAYGDGDGYGDEQDAAGSVVLRAPGAPRAKHVQRALAILSQTGIMAAINQAARQSQRARRALQHRGGGGGNTADSDAGYDTDTSRAQSELRIPAGRGRGGRGRPRPSRRFAPHAPHAVPVARNSMARGAFEAMAAFTDDDGGASSVSSASRPRSVASVGTRPRVHPIRVANPRSASMPLASAAAAYSVLDTSRGRLGVDAYGLPIVRMHSDAAANASVSQPPSPPHDPPPPPQLQLLPPGPDGVPRAPLSVYGNDDDNGDVEEEEEEDSA
jgi:hypothetical protein